MTRRRYELGFIIVLVVAGVAMQLPLWGWLVEDAAISFAYARNLADGFGAVAFPGGERVEGYSNPLWVLGWSVAQWVGLSPFDAEPFVGLGLGLLAVALAALWSSSEHGRLGAAVTAFVVVFSAQHAIWSQSGLENPLFAVLLAATGWRVATGGAADRSAPLLALGLALTRPEGLLYAVLAGLVAVGTSGTWREGVARARTWLAWLAVPLLGYHAVRFLYFAQELPAPYHAKVGNRTLNMVDFDGRAWRQVRAFVREGGLAPFLLLLPIGAAGLRGPRAAGGLVVTAVLAVAMLPLEGFDRLRAAILAAVVCALPLLAASRERRTALVAATFLWCGGVFCLVSGGDWMDGYRFLSLLVPPAAVLMGAAVVELAAVVGTRSRAAGVALGVAGVLYAGLQIQALRAFAVHGETTPHQVHRQLDHYVHLAEVLDLDHQVLVADHDLGALMWWGGDRVEARDTRGLVDLPFALHGWTGPVATEELEHQTPVDFAHLHESTELAMAGEDWFREGFVEVPGYPAGALRPHGAQYVRRTRLLVPATDEAPLATFVDAWGAPVMRLQRLEIDSPEVWVSGGLSVQVALQAVNGVDVRFTVFLHQAGAVVASWDLPPGFGWVPPSQWHPHEEFRGTYTVPLPPEAQGAHEVGVVVWSADGVPLAVASADGPADEAAEPLLAAGELRVPDLTVQVSTPAEVAGAAALDVMEALAFAKDKRCEPAEVAWTQARHHLPLRADWRAQVRPTVAEALAKCWARRARGDLRGPALLVRVQDLRRARAWQPASELAEFAGHRVSAKAWMRGRTAVEEADHEAALMWFSASVAADPSRAWSRRYAEQARGRLLSE